MGGGDELLQVWSGPLRHCPEGRHVFHVCAVGDADWCRGAPRMVPWPERQIELRGLPNAPDPQRSPRLPEALPAGAHGVPHRRARGDLSQACPLGYADWNQGSSVEVPEFDRQFVLRVLPGAASPLAPRRLPAAMQACGRVRRMSQMHRFLCVSRTWGSIVHKCTRFSPPASSPNSGWPTPLVCRALGAVRSIRAIVPRVTRSPAGVVPCSFCTQIPVLALCLALCGGVLVIEHRIAFRGHRWRLVTFALLYMLSVATRRAEQTRHGHKWTLAADHQMFCMSSPVCE